MLITRNLSNLCKSVNIYCYRTLYYGNFNQSTISKRFSHYTPSLRPRSFKESKYLNRDRIPNGFQLIYRAPMEHYLMASKNVSTITFLMVAMSFAYKLSKGDDLVNLPLDEFSGLVLGGSDLIYFGIGFLLITIAIRYVIEKYPLRIYRNRDSYIAIFQGQLPFKNQRLFFEKGDVSEAKPFILNPWKESMYQMKNKKVLLLEDYFKTPSELYNMLTQKSTK